MIDKKRTAISMVLVLTLLLVTALCGCGQKDAEAKPSAPAATVAPTDQPAPTEPPEIEADPGRLDGERFEGTVILEGMEETVRYEHVQNEDLGFALDYEYEALERHRASDREYFLSRYDDPDDPRNYLEVTNSAEDADAAAQAVIAELSRDFDTVVTSPLTLDGAGACTRIDASGAKEGRAPAGSLESVYILPAADGCRVATAHYTAESAEGFGARFAAMMNTLTVTTAASPAAGSKVPASEAKTLVVVFSATGTTKGVAEKLAAITGADLYEIIPAEPYTSGDLNYGDSNSRATREHNDKSARPAIGSEKLDLTQYDTIYLGYPIWFGEEPRIMDAFAEQYDFSGKTVIPFCTSGSSGIGRSGQNIAECAGTGIWLEGKRFSGSTTENDLRTWLEGLK